MRTLRTTSVATALLRWAAPAYAQQQRTDLVSTASGAAAAEVPVAFAAAAADGGRVLFTTAEPLVAADTDDPTPAVRRFRLAVAPRA